LPKNSGSTFRLSAAFLEVLHDEAVSQVWPQSDPNSPGEYRDRSLLESAANRPFQSAFGADAYPSLIEKAGALFHSVIANHCFHNGNKRTAVLGLDCFLLANGHVLNLEDQQTYVLARVVASYREAGRSHDQVLRDIFEALEPAVVSLASFKTDRSLQALYDSLMKDRRYIRTHPLNKQ
jgi:death-on-curing protein